LQSRNQQVAVFHDFTETECGKTLAANVPGPAFGLEASHVRKIRSNAAKKPKRAHRPSAFNEDETAAIGAFTNNGYRTNNCVTQRGVLRFIEPNIGKCLTYRWMASFLKSHDDQMSRTIVRPQRNMRLKVPRECLEGYIDLIKEYVPLVPTDLIFNIDESGLSEWDERKAKAILIPIEARRTTLHYPVSRKIRHQTFVCCLTAAGDAYCPLVLSAQPAARDGFQHQVLGFLEWNL
jgi:hypothetical protein